jgi:uncharacterized protein YecT (DUF1311 family)
MPCVNSANTVERNHCLAAEAESMDTLLRAEVRRVERVLRSREAEAPMLRLAPAFRASQSKWQSFRDADCTFRSQTYVDGTGGPAEGMWCQIEHGRNRLKYLQGMR